MIINSEYYTFWIRNCNLKEGSKKTYTNNLRCFGNYLVHRGITNDLDFDKFYFDPEENNYHEIDESFIDEYIEYVKNTRKVSKISLYLRVTVLTSFFNFLQDHMLIKSNPMRYFHNNYYENKLKDRALSNADTLKMLKAAEEMDPFMQKYYTLILTMVTCGLRVSEVLKLSQSQIDFDSSFIVIDKGTKTYTNIVVMTKVLKDQLCKYLSHPNYTNWSKGGDREVFFSNSGPLKYDHLRQIIDTIAKRAKIKRSLTPHDFRYTTARLMLESGIPISAIQEQMRHRLITTTLRYLPNTLSSRNKIDYNSNRFKLMFEFQFGRSFRE